MKSKITTHILDTEKGKPANGVEVQLDYEEGGNWQQIAKSCTDDDGRLMSWLENESLKEGKYKITFFVESYLANQSRETFYPEVSIQFFVKDLEQHYHVPLLLNAHGYSTYRGS
mgnify:CR=1 FL=1